MRGSVTLLPFMLGKDVFYVESELDKTRLCGPKRATALCEVLNTAAVVDQIRLLDSLRNRTGQSFEGVASYGFHREYPEEISRGNVAVDFFETEQTVSEPQFFLAALTLIRGRLEMAPEPSLERAFRSCLRVLRWRRSVLGAGWMTRPFAPSMRLEVYDALSTSPNHSQVIAEILSDGKQGRILAIERSDSAMLADVFAQPVLALSSSMVPVPGVDPIPVKLEPFTREALNHAVRERLAGHQLRGAWLE